MYNFLIYGYYLLIWSVSFFNKKAKLWIEGRKDWEIKLKNSIDNNEKWIWFHCSSLGEYEDVCEIFLQLKEIYPNKKTILSFFSPSGYEQLKVSSHYDLITYLPLDTKNNAKKFLNIIKPELILFSRSELWYNFLTEIKAAKIPIFLLSLRLNKSNNYIKWPIRVLYKKCFNVFTKIYCQDIETQNILKKYFFYDSTFVTGNTRIHRIKKQSEKDYSFREIEEYIENDFTIIFGSSLPKEEKLFLEIFKKFNNQNIKWIVVPHEMNECLLPKALKEDDFILYSKLNFAKNESKILIIDKVGILKHIYKYAHLAIIGGGFNRIGIHNILEPAIYGIPVIFGPNHKNYDEAIKLLNLGGAYIFKNKLELESLIQKFINKPLDFNTKKHVQNYILNNNDASSLIVQSIIKSLEK